MISTTHWLPSTLYPPASALHRSHPLLLICSFLSCLSQCHPCLPAPTHSPPCPLPLPPTPASARRRRLIPQPRSSASGTTSLPRSTARRRWTASASWRSSCRVSRTSGTISRSASLVRRPRRQL